MSWFKLYRAIEHHEVFHDAELLKLFLWCLIRANTVESKRHGILVKPGQFITGRDVACDDLGWKKTTWYDRMKRLQEMGCISLLPDNARTVVTILNWDTYNGIQEKKNDAPTANRQQSDNEPTSIRQQSGAVLEFNNSRIQENKTPAEISENPEDKKPTNGHAIGGDGCSAGQDGSKFVRDVFEEAKLEQTVEDLQAIDKHLEGDMKTFLSGEDDQFKKFVEAFPGHKRRNRAECWRLWQAIIEAAILQGHTRLSFETFLISKAAEYAKCGLVTEGNGNHMEDWLRKGAYNDPPEAWRSTKRKSDSRQSPRVQRLTPEDRKVKFS